MERITNTTRADAAAPRVDIYENKDELLLVADLPGATEESVKVHLDKDVLTVEARVEEPAKPGTALAREWRPTDWRRTFLVPNTIDRDRIVAELKDGILRLQLPKSDGVKPRRIEVRAG
jgi:HSP20 family protein